MPVRALLVGVAYVEECVLRERTRSQLDAHREAAARETAGNGHRRHAGEVERASVGAQPEELPHHRLLGGEPRLGGDGRRAGGLRRRNDDVESVEPRA